MRKHSVNTMLAALNGLLDYYGWTDLKLKPLKIQKSMFCDGEKELTMAEYIRLVRTAEVVGNQRLSHIIQTICSTGIRVSELKFITVSAVHSGIDRSNIWRDMKALCKDAGVEPGKVFPHNLRH